MKMTNYIQITKIQWIDKEAEEASVYFNHQDCKFSFFSHPCDIVAGEKQEVTLSGLVFDDKSTKPHTENSKNLSLTAVDDNEWSYKGIGEVISEHPAVLNFGGIYIDLDGELPPDLIEKGNILEVCIGRLDGTLKE